MFMQFFLSCIYMREIYIFLDVFEKVILVVVYLCIISNFGDVYVGFVIGKFKIVLFQIIIILCFEFCVVVLGIELVQIVFKYLDIDLDVATYYIDSKVVLGYLNN